MIYMFGVRLYLDSAPVVANAADIGLYSIVGGNSVFRWIESDISAYAPTYTWKTGILKPDFSEPTQESVDVAITGNLPTIGGTSIKIINTIMYAGAYTQFDKILSDNGIHFNELRMDIIRFEIVGGALVNADGSVHFRGLCGNTTWDEKELTIPLETALLKRKSNLATIINKTDFPNASDDIVGQTVPVTYGEFKPQYNSNGTIIHNGFAKFVRTANNETVYENLVIQKWKNDDGTVYWSTMNADFTGIKAFPIVSNNGAIPPVIYSIKLLTLSSNINWFDSAYNPIITGTITLDYFEGMYIKVIDGIGENKYRRIKSGNIDLDTAHNVLILEIEDVFEETLAGNATATEIDNSWVQIVDIAREYRSDIWRCKDYLDVNGGFIYNAMNIFGYLAQSIAKVTTENTDANILTAKNEFMRLPLYAYKDIGDGNKNLLDIDVKLFNGDPDTMDSFLILPVSNVALYNESDLTEWGGVGYTKKSAGLFYDGTKFNINSEVIDGALTSVNNKNYYGYYQRALNLQIKNVVWWHFITFGLPEIPANFYENFEMYILIRMMTAWEFFPPGYPDSYITVSYKKFMGSHISALAKTDWNDDEVAPILGKLHTFDNVADFYYDYHRPSKGNTAFYYDNNGSTTFSGYMNIPITGIDNRDKYNMVKGKFALGIRRKNGVAVTINLDDYIRIYEMAVALKKSVSIKDAIYSPFQGRIYGTTWGQSEGSSSFSSSSQSSPSSSSSSSHSSMSSSSSSSETGETGRKVALAMINNPIDIMEHVLRLQMWSETGETKNWGKEYATSPLIDISTSEGGFDYEDLDPIKALRPAWQILNYNDAWSDEMLRRLCKSFFLVNYQHPETGKESVAYIADKSLTVPAMTITLDDIIGPVGQVVYPQVKNVYCEPYIKYCLNNANGQYEKIIQVTNTSKPIYDASYVIGVTGSNAEMLWTRGHVLWEAYRQIEPMPTDISENPLIVKDADALWFLDTLYNWMGAINIDGDPVNVIFEPKKRIVFNVPYQVGKGWFLTQHHKLQLPHQTDDVAIEFMIEQISKNINKGKEIVTVQAILYGAATEIAMYVQDVYDAGTLLADWQDVYTPAAANDIQDVT